VNQSTASETTDGTAGALVLSDVSHSNSVNISMRAQSIGANTTMTAAFICNGAFTSGTPVTSQCGIFFRESATGKIILLSYGVNGGNNADFEVQYLTSSTVFSADLVDNTQFMYMYGQSTPRFARAVYDGTNIKFFLCGMFPVNTTNCQTAFTELKAAHFTTAPDQWGYYVGAKSGPVSLELLSYATQ
jgi:hypothetical protein